MIYIVYVSKHCHTKETKLPLLQKIIQKHSEAFVSCSMQNITYYIGLFKACGDNHVKCGLWAQLGECDKNANFMGEQCKKSCNKC